MDRGVTADEIDRLRRQQDARLIDVLAYSLYGGLEECAARGHPLEPWDGSVAPH